MIIIIDGYNFLKQHKPDGYIDESDRRAFLHQVAQYSRRKKHKVVVAFDGGPSEWPSKEKVAGVTVFFSGSKQSADKIIMQYIQENKNKELLLVSSDHELALFASKRTVASIGVPEFYTLLHNALHADDQKEKEQDIADICLDEGETDLNRIMEQASQRVPLKPADMPRKNATLKLSRFSKKERALLKKLKKL